MDTLTALADTLSLRAVLHQLKRRGGWELVDHFTQGEFHHDVIVRAQDTTLPGAILVVSTNCNGGVKELLCFDEPPTSGALWHARCPDNVEFAGVLPPLRGRATTVHWFEPCALLAADARSELKPECRVRQPGGGWMKSES